MITCKLSTILGARRIKITDVSRATGISRTTLTTLYYNRANGVQFDTLDRLCRYLECEIGELIGVKEGSTTCTK